MTPTSHHIYSAIQAANDAEYARAASRHHEIESSTARGFALVSPSRLRRGLARLSLTPRQA